MTHCKPRRTARLACLLSLGAASFVGATAARGATGAKRHTESFTAVAQLATISSEHGYPAPGGAAVLSGPLIQHPGGNGAEVDHVTITGQPKPNTFSSRATGIDYLEGGSERFTFTSTITVEPDGSLRLIGSGLVTGGTERYRGVRGHFTFTGRASSPAGIITYHARGSISQP